MKCLSCDLRIDIAFCQNKVPQFPFNQKDYITKYIYKSSKVKVIGKGSSNGIDLDYFNPLLFSCYKSFIECEFIPHDLDTNISDEGKYKFMQKLPRLSVVKGTLLHEGMIINQNADAPGLGNFDYQATLFLNDPPQGSGLGQYNLVFGDNRVSGIEDLLDIEDNDDKAEIGKWLNENAVCGQETVEYKHTIPDNHWDQTRFIPAQKNRLILHRGTTFQRYEYLGQGDLYMLNVYMNNPPKSQEFLEENQIESDADNY